MLFLFRIGSKPVLFFISIVLVIFFSACSDNSDNELTIFKALDESLTNSNGIINKSTEVSLTLLKDKTTDPATANRANFWYPIALAVKEKTANAIYYIEKTKILLKKEADFDSIKNSYKGDDKKAVRDLFVTKEIGEDLYVKLKTYVSDVLSLNADINAMFADELLRTTQPFDPPIEKKEFNSIFKDISTGAALAVLSKFQNNVKISENSLIQFCNRKVGVIIENYDTYSAIVGQSSTYVRSGEEIEITAGIGAFSRGGKPNMTFNGHEVEINEFGTAIYRFKAPIKAGKYIVPVKISYTDQDGREQYITKDVEYTVKK